MSSRRCGPALSLPKRDPSAIGVGPARPRLLLYSLVAAKLLTEQNGRFSNTSEATQFLAKGLNLHWLYRHPNISAQWVTKLKTAESIRTGVPQTKVDFSNSHTGRRRSIPSKDKRARSTVGAWIVRAV